MTPDTARVYGDPKDADNTHAILVVDGERGPYLQFDSERGVAGLVRDAQDAGVEVVVLKKDDLFPLGVRLKTSADMKPVANVIKVHGRSATVKCAYCDQHFHARMANVERGWDVYCSKACKAKAQALRKVREARQLDARAERVRMRTHPLSTEGIGQDGTEHALPCADDIEEARDAEQYHMDALYGAAEERQSFPDMPSGKEK